MYSSRFHFMICLWCKKPSRLEEPEEHIFPESLGCPEDLVFRNGEVCGKCNSRHAKLDQSLLTDFDIARFVAGVPNKRGESPTIATRANARGIYRNGEPYLFVNMDRRDKVMDAGGVVSPFQNRSSDLELSITHSTLSSVSFRIQQRGFCNSVKSVRGLHKIGLSLFARDFGMESASSSEYDEVRAYVLDGVGDRTAILLPALADNPEYVSFAMKSDGSVFPEDVSVYGLVCCLFIVDLSRGQRSLPQLKELCTKMRGDAWTWAPI